jgi:hypothetical protein
MPGGFYPGRREGTGPDLCERGRSTGWSSFSRLREMTEHSQRSPRCSAVATGEQSVLIAIRRTVRRGDLDAGGGAEMQLMPKPSLGAVGGNHQIDRECLIRSRTWPSSSGSSAIRRKVEPQGHAECEVKPDAGCDGNSGRIHFPVPLRTEVRLPDHAADGAWVVKMVPLSLENGCLGL